MKNYSEAQPLLAGLNYESNSAILPNKIHELQTYHNGGEKKKRQKHHHPHPTPICNIYLVQIQRVNWFLAECRTCFSVIVDTQPEDEISRLRHFGKGGKSSFPLTLAGTAISFVGRGSTLRRKQVFFLKKMLIPGQSVNQSVKQTKLCSLLHVPHCF